MNTAVAIVTIAGGAILLLASIAGTIAFLRRSFVDDRDSYRQSAFAALRDAADAEERRCEARLGERDDWIHRLESHHAGVHRRCATAPLRDG